LVEPRSTRSLRRSPERRHFRDASLLIGAAGIGCLAFAARPPSPETPILLCFIVGMVTLCWAVLTFTVAPSMGPRGLELSLLGLTLGGTTITATAATPVGCIGPLLVLMAGIPAMAEILPRRAAWRQALLALAFWVGAMVLPAASMIDWYFVAIAVVIVPMEMQICVRMVERMNDLALSDPLTGVLNRNGLAMQAPVGRSLALRAGLPTTVVAIDLDMFKSYNDEHGHPAGDRLLVELTEAWFGELRDADVLARTGGDEFVVVLPGTSPEEAAPLLERMSERSPSEWTAGVAVWERDVDMQAAVAAADAVLYAAKRRPRCAGIPEQAVANEDSVVLSDEGSAPQ
jgi:diguanylate cyclase (GGDEF)-like protein